MIKVALLLVTQQVGGSNSKFDFKQLREEEDAEARCQAGRMKQIQTYYSGFESKQKKVCINGKTNSETLINKYLFLY